MTTMKKLATILLTAVMTLFAPTAFAGTSAAAASESEGGMFDDATALWCLDSDAKEIYTTLPDGTREPLVLAEQFAGADVEKVFDEDLPEALDGADALSASFLANAWETVIETIYTDDAFAQRIEIIGDESENEAGHRCRLLRAPGLATMYRAFQDSRANSDS